MNDAMDELCVNTIRTLPMDAVQQANSGHPGTPMALAQWSVAGYPWTSGVETTTGPLGQGVATSVGMAIAERWLASYFNRPGFELFQYDIWKPEVRKQSRSEKDALRRLE